jgi:hypothetical protein
MKTGFNPVRQDPELDEMDDMDEMYIASLLTLFTSNSIVNASDYSDLCGRNGVTKEDMRYGLIFEVFEFLNNPNLVNDLKEVEKQLEYEYSDDEDEDIDNIFNDKNMDEFTRIDSDKIDGLEDEEIEFVNKMHKYYDEWDDWVPKNELEIILKNAIDKTTNI